MGDLMTLERLGLTGVSPPLTTPTPEGLPFYRRETGNLAGFGFSGPFLDYTSVKRLRLRFGIQDTARRLADLSALLREQGAATPIWSIADEPGNARSNPDRLTALSQAIRSASQIAKRAGHLNRPADRSLVALFDIVLVNAGYGVDHDDIRDLRKRGVEPWFYNMDNPRAAAGFYLWRVGAGGYLQWHARMPAADPFDPTDGREDDFQLLPPMADPCPAVPDLDRRLLDLAEGIQDLRWLLWLEQRPEAAARRLINRLRAEIPIRWAEMSRLPSGTFDHWRAEIRDTATDGSG